MLFTAFLNLYVVIPANWIRQREYNKLATLVDVLRKYFSDSDSLSDISTASNAASHFIRSKKRVCKVIAFDATLYYNSIMKETSDVSTNRFYIYILYSLHDEGFYIGYTTDLKLRLIKHAKGEVIATKFRRPLKLIHYEFFINQKDALAREEFLKSGYGRKQLKEVLKRTMNRLLEK